LSDKVFCNKSKKIVNKSVNPISSSLNLNSVNCENKWGGREGDPSQGCLIFPNLKGKAPPPVKPNPPLPCRGTMWYRDLGVNRVQFNPPLFPAPPPSLGVPPPQAGIPINPVSIEECKETGRRRSERAASRGREKRGGRRGRQTRAPENSDPLPRAPNIDTPKSTPGRMFIQDMSVPKCSKMGREVKEGGKPKRIFNVQGESRRVGHGKPREKVRIFSRVINEVNALKAQDAQVHQAPFVRVKISKKNVWALGLLDTGNTTKNSLISEEFFNICEGEYKHANHIRLNTAAQGGGLTVL